MSDKNPVVKYSATEIAQRLKDAGADVHLPTDEQIPIVESLHTGPSLIIAGAGSGKTETMSARVVWLVANEIVTPDQILGLTFTRKAAGELSARIRKRLRQLKATGVIANKNLDLAANVSTYHSYAGKVLEEHAIRLGIDVDGEPIGEAAAWQIANSIVQNYEIELADIKHSPSTIVSKLLDLVGQLGEHGKTVEELRKVSEEWLELYKDLGEGGNEEVRKAISTLKERLALIPLIERFENYRKENGLSTFNDQMAWAAKLLSSEFSLEIARKERSKYRIVLLDEYQDTSYSQVRFLSGLYGSNSELGEHQTTAVGDPNQSIYGWRSASAGTIAAFADEFGNKANIKKFSLQTTWRNDQAILGVANQTITKLNAVIPAEKDFEKVRANMEVVGELRARPGAGIGEIAVGQYESLTLEAEAIADYFENAWKAPERLAKPEKKRSSFAVLVRSRKYISEIEQALRSRDIPVEVVGLGGLIHVPEVADLIALVRVLIQPEAGSALARLLVGPHFALGAKDLHGLGKFVRDLARENGASPTSTFLEVLEKGVPSLLEADDFAYGSAIEALDQIERAPKEYFSSNGYKRLLTLSKDLATLRRRANGSITETLIEAERYLFLDSEVIVNNHSAIGRRYLDQFLDEAGKFQRNGGTLFSFLEWLKIADSEEGGIKFSNVSVTNEAVQILTIHAAKGLEWDFVAVPGLVKKHFPSQPKEYAAWTTNIGEIPIQMRGDKDQLVDFKFPQGQSETRIKEALKDFKSNVKFMSLFEEYRLAYVAFTRARSNLICTSSWFGTAIDPVEPSELFNVVLDFVSENKNFGKILSAEPKPTTKNPVRENPRSGIWPKPKSRQSEVAQSVELVKSIEPAEIKSLANSDNLLFQDAWALINEATQKSNLLEVALPSRLSVSTLVNLKENPEGTALNIRRPVPNHIDKYARRGTEFHLWIEKRYKDPQIFDDDIFDAKTESDSETEDLPLKELQEKWLASEWANKVPVPGGIEVPFETVIAGVLLRGRIDAVYQEGDKYVVVDWKTGKVKSGNDLEAAAIQLAMYRLAYSKLYQVPVEKISAAFHYVGYNETVRPADLYTEGKLEELITSNLAS